MNLDKIVFKDDDFEMEVFVSKEDKTCWLTQEEIAKLFGRKRQTITYHLSNSLDDFRQKCSTSVEIFDKSFGRPSKRYSMGVVKCVGEKLKSNRGVALEKYIKDYFAINNTNDSDDIIVYNNGNINLAVSVSPLEETIWLSVNQIAILFETTVQNIYSHIKNIHAEGEVGHSVLKKSLNTDLSLVEPTDDEKELVTVADDGKSYVTKFYNLDMILAVGYRVKSKRAIEFRKWATNVLKNYLLKGYAIDPSRTTVSEENYRNLKNDVENIKHEITDIKEKMFIVPLKERLFFNAQYYDAYDFLVSLVKQAKSELILIDPYFDESGLRLLTHSNKEIRRIVCFKDKLAFKLDEYEAFKKQCGAIRFYINKKMHDRFLIIDNKICYSLGASINHYGRKTFAVIKIESECLIDNLIKQSFINRFVIENNENKKV